MKKAKIGLGVLLILLLMSGCSWFYNLLKSEDFKEHFGALGYTISDSETGLIENDKYYVASKDDVPYKIEYYEFENEVEAKKAYEEYKDNIKNYITTDSKNLETTGAVFKKIVAESEGEYIVISRVKNSLIFINGTKEFKEEINKLLEDIKY